MHIQSRLFILLLALTAALPAAAAKLVDAPPPPPLPEHELDADGTAQKPVTPGSPSRGQLLYENHCMSCHESVAAIQSKQQLRTHAALREAVARWAQNTGLRWREEEIEEVARYLGSRYYRFEQQSNLK